MADKNDRDLVNGLKANNPKYQKLFVDNYAGLLLSIVMQRGLSREDGMEVVNDTFYKATKNIGMFDIDRDTKLLAWLKRIATNTATDKYRQTEKSPISESIEDRVERGIQDRESLWQDSDTPESETGILSKKLLREGLKSLSDIDKKTLMGRACGQQYKEISIALNKNENAVKVAHHRALKKLKEKYINLLESHEDKDEVAALKAYLYSGDINEKAAN